MSDTGNNIRIGGWRRGAWAVLAAAAVAAAAGGCANKSSRTTVITDDSPARFEESRRLAGEAVKLQKEAEEALAAGREKDWIQKSDKAIGLYQQALGKNRDMFMVWNNLGLLLMDRQNYVDAAECFKSAADLQPGDARPYYNLGLIYQRVVYDQQALEWFMKALERDPRHLPSLRGAIASGKRLDLTDEKALERVRSALLMEVDPTWRRIFEVEQLRIEGSLARSGRAVQVGG